VHQWHNQWYCTSVLLHLGVWATPFCRHKWDNKLGVNMSLMAGDVRQHSSHRATRLEILSGKMQTNVYVLLACGHWCEIRTTKYVPNTTTTSCSMNSIQHQITWLHFWCVFWCLICLNKRTCVFEFSIKNHSIWWKGQVLNHFSAVRFGIQRGKRQQSNLLPTHTL
jgi:hypothetical protein